jgi:hypothetical protein
VGGVLVRARVCVCVCVGGWVLGGGVVDGRWVMSVGGVTALTHPSTGKFIFSTSETHMNLAHRSASGLCSSCRCAYRSAYFASTFVSCIDSEVSTRGGGGGEETRQKLPTCKLRS